MPTSIFRMRFSKKWNNAAESYERVIFQRRDGLTSVSPFLLRPGCKAFRIVCMEQTAKQVVFKGSVQGVGFRYTTHRIAGRYNLSGYVRNMPNGTVEAVFQGTAANIQAGLEEIKDKFGGYIRETKVTDKPVSPHYTDFKIAY